MTQRISKTVKSAPTSEVSLNWLQVRHLAARYLEHLRKEVRETDGRKFPCSWPWLGMIADEARNKLKPIATDNGIPWPDVQLLANADRLAGVK